MRIWRNVIIGTLVVGTLTAVLISARGANERNRAGEAARRFLAAMDDGDQAAAERSLTRRAREQMRSSDLLPHGNGEKRSTGFTVGEPAVHEDTATVPVVLKDVKESTDATLKLRREEGEWRVSGIALATYPGGPQFNVDFENPESVIPEAYRTVGFALGQMTHGMEAGAAAFAKGFEQGYKEATPGGNSGTIEEVPPSPAPADSKP
jgi:hypothetical protein